MITRKELQAQEMDGLFTAFAVMRLLTPFAVSALLLGVDTRDERGSETRHSPDLGEH